MFKNYTCNTVTISPICDTKHPGWHTIFAEGVGELSSGEKFLVNKSAFDYLKDNLDNRGIEIVVDYEHQTLRGVQSPAAGWCKGWRWTPGIGIEAKISWTRQGAQRLLAGEYRYCSPVFYVRTMDKLVAGIHSIALTNTPRINNISPLISSKTIEPVNNEFHHNAELIFSVGRMMGVTKKDLLKFGPHV